nr:MAG TPA: hypothetical protein [Caudoviricetes sp.]
MSIKEEIFKNYYDELTFDDPIDYKGLLLYPVSIRKINKFLQSSSVLRIQKEYIPDKEIIKMSYLKFLMTNIDKEKEEYGESLTFDLLALCFMICMRIEEISIRLFIDEGGKTKLILNDVEINENDFDYLRKLILYQNLPNYDDELMNPDLKNDLEQADKIKNGGEETEDFEHLIANLVIGTGMNIDDVKNLPIRKFYIIGQVMDRKLHYSIYKQASVGGFVEFKQPITHYLKKNIDLLENKVTTVETLKNNLNI